MVPGYHDRMIVSWVSNSTDGSPLVVWGVAADALNESAPATHDTYTAADFTNCMGIAAINTLDSPFPHLSSHDLRSVTPHVSRITLIRPCHCVTHVTLTSACHMSPTAADAAVPATTTPPPASCSFTPATCTTQCCSRCSPPAGTAAPSRHTSHVTRHTSHVTRPTSHVTRHTQVLLLVWQQLGWLEPSVLLCGAPRRGRYHGFHVPVRAALCCAMLGV